MGQRGKQRKNKTSPTLGEVAKSLGLPQQTASGHLKAAEDYDTLPKPLKAKVDAGDVSVKVAKQAADNVQPKLSKAKADGALPKDVVKIFDEEAAKRKEINAFMTFIEKAASGFAYHENTAMKRRWSKADKDIICRHLKTIRSQLNQWSKKLCQ